ncbi:MAG: hypothetical protein WAX04_10950 [Oscillospiraceae bacterium]
MIENMEESIIDASGGANIVASVLSVVLSLLLFEKTMLIIMLTIVIVVPLLIEYLVVIPLAAKHYKSEFFDEDDSDTVLPSADSPRVQLLFETLLKEDKLNMYGLARALYPESRCQSYWHYVKGTGYLCGTLMKSLYCSVCLTFILY